MADGSYMSLRSRTLALVTTWKIWTFCPLGVMRLFFLARYISMQGLTILLCLVIALSSSLRAFLLSFM